MAALVATAPVRANPSGAQVVQGQAVLRQQGGTLSVTTSDGTIINWQHFGIGVGETTRFVQPSATSQVLNRVTGGDPSQILGTLESNGRVFLINPNGVAFGKGSRVDVAGLVVSTLKLSDADFTAGRLNFGEAGAGAGSIRNEGRITTPRGGFVYLVAPQVENSGLIHTPEGEVMLAAGHRVSLVNPRTPEVAWEVTAPASQAINLGEVVARRIVLQGAGVRNAGLLQATTAVVGENGQVLLKAARQVEQTASGRIVAQGLSESGGARGGLVDIIAGERAVLQGRIDVTPGPLPSPSRPGPGAPAGDRLGAGVLVVGPPPTGAGSWRGSPVAAKVARDGTGGPPAPAFGGAGVLGPGRQAPASGDAGSAARPEAAPAGPAPADPAGPWREPVRAPAGPVRSPAARDTPDPSSPPETPAPLPMPGPDPRHALPAGALGSGGRVRIFAPDITLGEGLEVDASGPGGGGTVLVGGEQQGAFGGAPNALSVRMEASARIAADATQSGTGGRVILWADDSARVYGRLSARGGAQGGDGGFIETSGLRVLDVTQPADASAPKGKAGTWLLDPYDITIGGPLDFGFLSSTDPFTGLSIGSTQDSAVVTVNTIVTALQAGSNVTVSTGGGGTQAGNITVAAPLLVAAGQTGGQGGPTLTLSAHNDILINANIGVQPGGAPLNVQLAANSDYAGGGSVIFGTATMSLAGGTLSSVTSTAIAPGATLTLTEARMQSVTVGGTGTLALGSGGTLQDVVLRAPGLATGNGTVLGALRLGAGTTFQVPNGQSLTLSGSGSSVLAAQGESGTLQMAGGSVTFSGGGVFDVGAGITVRGYGSLNPLGVAELRNSGTLQADTASQTLQVTVDTLTSSGTLRASGGTLDIQASSKVTQSGSASSSAGALRVNATGTLEHSGSTQISGTGTVSLAGAQWINTGTIFLDSGVLNLGGTLDKSALENRLLRQAGSTLNLTGRFDNAGSTLDIGSAGLFGVGGLGTLSGTVAGGTLRNSDATPLLRTQSGTLSNVTIDGRVQLAGNQSLYAPQGLTLGAGSTLEIGGTRTVWMGADTGLSAADPQQGGTLVLTSGTLSMATGTLTIGSGVTVRGSGGVAGGTALNNSGTVVADNASALLYLGGSSLVNRMAGTLSASGGAELRVNSSTFSNQGVLDIASNSRVWAPYLTGSLINSGLIRGSGTLTAALFNDGTLQPGGSGAVGTLTLQGNLIMGSSMALVDLEVAGTGPGEVDRVAVTGNLVLGGGIRARPIDGFVPAGGDTFTLLSASGGITGNFMMTSGLAPGFTGAAQGQHYLVTVSGNANCYYVCWTGSVSGSWNVAGNWTGSAVPGANDVVQILTPGASVTLSGQPATVRNLHTAAGTSLTLSGANLSLTNPNRSSQLRGNLSVNSGATLDTAGTTTIDGSNVYFNGGAGYVANAGTLKLQSGGVLNFGGYGAVSNSGLLVAEPAAGATVFLDTTVDNLPGGTLRVVAQPLQTGTLRVGLDSSRPGYLYQSGSIDLLAGATLQLNSTLGQQYFSELREGSSIGGPGLFQVASGKTAVTGAASARNIEVTGGATFGAPSPTTGGGTLTVSGLFTTTGTGANLRGTGSAGGVVVSSTGTMLLAGATTTIGEGFTLTNQSTTGTSAIDGATVYFNSSGGNVVNTGTLTLRNGGITNWPGGWGSITNTGLLKAQPAAGGTVFLDTNVDNAAGATLDVAAGVTLRLGYEDPQTATSRPGYLQQSGAIQIGSGATLELRTGLNNEPSSTLQSGSSITGSGLFKLLRGFTGVFGRASASNVELTGGAYLGVTATGQGGGTLDVSGRFSTTGTGGNLRGTGSAGGLVVASTGTMLLAGATTTLGSSFTLTHESTTGQSAIDGATVYFNGGAASIVNTGTLNWVNGGVLQQGGYGSITNSGTINVAPTGQQSAFIATTLVNDTSGTVALLSGTFAVPSGQSGTLDNRGVLLFDPGPQAGATLDATLLNSATGTLELRSGQGRTGGAFQTNQGLIRLVGGDLQLANPLTNAGTIEGHGVIDLDGAALTNTGTLRPGGVGKTGTLSVFGSLVLAGSGVAEFDVFESGGLSADKLEVFGGVTLGGAVSVNIVPAAAPGIYPGDSVPLITGTVVSASRPGSAILSGSTHLNLASTLIYEMGEAVSLAFTDAGTQVFTNRAGSLNWSDTGNWSLGGLPGPNDTVQLFGSAGANTVVHFGPGIQAPQTIGALTIGTGATLDVSGSGLTVVGASWLSGGLNVAGGMLRLSSGLNSTSRNLTITGGTLSLVGESDISSLRVYSGGVLEVQAGAYAAIDDLTLGGTLSGPGQVNVAGEFLATSLGQGSGPMLLGTGTLTTAGGTVDAELSLSGGRTWINTGLLNIAGADGRIRFVGAADSLNLLTNAEGATLQIDGQHGTPLLAAPGPYLTSNRLDNLGLVLKTSEGEQTISVPVRNQPAAEIDVQGGTLGLTGLFTQSGTVSLSGGATLKVPGGFTNATTGVVRGSGTLDLSIPMQGTRGQLTNLGIVKPGGYGTVGKLEVIGDVTLGASGTLEVDLHGSDPTQYDRLVASGVVTLGGTLQAALGTRYTPSGSVDFDIVRADLGMSGSFGSLDLPPNISGAIVQGGLNFRLTHGASCPAATLCWDGGGGADTSWSNPLNWNSPGDDQVPGAGNSIGVPASIGLVNGVEVSLSSNSYSIPSLSTAAKNNLTISGTGTLTLTDAQATSTLLGGLTVGSGGRLVVNGTLAGSTLDLLSNGRISGSGVLTTTAGWQTAGTLQGLSIGGTGVGIAIGGTLDGVSLNTGLTVPGNHALTVVNGLTLGANTALTLGSGTGWASLNFDGVSQTLASGGVGSRVVIVGTEASRDINVYGSPLTIGAGVTLTAQGTEGRLRGSVVNQGSIDVPTGVALQHGSGGLINTGTITLGGAGLSLGAGGGSFTNTGTGKLTATSGTLNLAGRVTLDTPIDVGAGVGLRLDGSLTTATYGQIHNVAGNTVWLGGVLDNTGLQGNPGTLTLSAATPTFRLDANSADGGRIVGGTVAVDAVDRLVLNRGTLEGVRLDGSFRVLARGLLTVTNGLTLTSGSTLTVGESGNPNSASLYFDGMQPQTVAAETGQATLALAAGSASNTILVTNGQQVTLGSGITLRALGSDGRLQGNWLNQGTIEAGAGAGLWHFQGALNNSGSIGLTGGSLKLGSSSDLFTNAGTGTLTATGGTLNLAGGVALTNPIDIGPGVTLRLDGTLTTDTYSRIRNDPGNTVWLGGVLDNTGLQGNPGTLTLSAATPIFRLDQWSIPNGGRIVGGTVVADTADRLVLNRGTLDGVRLDGTFRVPSQGLLSVTHGLTLAAGSTLTVGESGNLNSASLYFEGMQPQTVVAETGQATLALAAGSASNTILVTNGQQVTLGSGITLRALGSDGRLQGNWLNQGTIEVGAGGSLWHLQGALTNSGVISLSGGNARLGDGNGGSFGNTSTGIVRGTGTISGAAWVNNGTIQPGGTAGTGTLTVNSNLTLGTTSVLDLEIAGASAGQSDRLAVTGILQLAGTLNTQLLENYQPSGLVDFDVITASQGVYGGFAASNLPSGFNGAIVSTPSSLYRLTYSGQSCPAYTLCWDGGGGRDTSWSNPANWNSPNNDQVPGAVGYTGLSASIALVNGVSVSLTGGSYSIPSLYTAANNALTVSGGTLTLANPTATSTLLGALTVSDTGKLVVGGTLAASSLTLAANGTVGGGTLGGTGQLSVDGSFSRQSSSVIESTLSSLSIRQLSGSLSPGAIQVAGPISLITVDPYATLTVDGQLKATGTLGDVLIRSAGRLDINAPVIAAGTVRGEALSNDPGQGRIGIGAGGSVSASGSGEAVVLAAGNGFYNNGQASLSAPNGRWLVYVDDYPDYHGRMGLAYDFKHYGVAYSARQPYAGPGTGNGFIYSVVPAPLTATASGNVGRTYDGTSDAPLAGLSATASGAYYGDQINLALANGQYASRHAGTHDVTAGVTIDTVQDLAMPAARVFGYTLASPTITFTGGVIEPKTVGLSAAKTYDGKTDLTGAVTLTTGVGSETLSYTGAIASDAHVATPGKFIQALTLGNATDGSGGLASNYRLPAELDPNSAPVTITPRTLTPTVSSAGVSKTYDGSTQAPAGFTPSFSFTGLASGDTGANLSGSGAAYNSPHVLEANTLTLSGLAIAGISGSNGSQASDYVLDATSKTVAATITPKALTVTGSSAAGKTYDATRSALVTVGTLDGFVGAETLTASAAGSFDKQDAGPRTVTASYTLFDGANGGRASNYTLAATTHLATISPKPLVVSGLASADKVYDGTTVAAVLGTAGLQAAVTPGTLTGSEGRPYTGDDVGVGGAVSATFNSPDVASASTVSFSGLALSGAQAANYTLLPHPTVAQVITPKLLGVTGVAVAAKTYDGTTLATLTGGTLGGVIAGDSVGLSQGTGSFADKNAGNAKPVTASGYAITGVGAGNYTLAQPTGLTGNITPASIEAVTGITAANKTYDGTTAATLTTTGAGFAGMVAGDQLSVAAAAGAFTDKNAGNGKTVNVTGITLSGADAGNYTLANNSATAQANITPASIQAVTGITAGSKTYDGTTSATLTTTGAGFTGMIAGDQLAVASATGAFADKNAGTGKVVNVTGIALGGADASNYRLQSNTTTAQANITPASIEAVTGITAANKTYDGTTAAALTTSSAGFTGMIAGDQLAVASATGAFADKNAGTGKTVNVTGITLGGQDGANYTLATSTATTQANITPASIEAVTGITAASKTYDGTTAATLTTAGAAFAGKVQGDQLSVASATGAFADKNAGTGKTVSVTGITLGGTDALNYVLQSTTASAQASITPATIAAVSGITAANKTYDGTSAATLSTTSAAFAGKIQGDQLSVAAATGAFADKNAGTDKTVNVTGITLGGADASNYTLQSTTASAQATITPAQIAAVTGITAASKTYDGTTAATLTTIGAGFAGMIAGDQLSVASATGAFADKNAGTGKTVNVTGITLGGADARNYTLQSTTAATQATIDPRTLALGTLTVADKVYDGTTSATVKEAQLQGVLAGDAVAVTLSSALAAFSDRNAGAGKTVTVSGLGLGGADAGNYRLGAAGSQAVASITPKSLALGTLTVADKVYDGKTTATVTAGTLEGVIAGDAVALDLARLIGSFSDKNAARDKAVSVSGITLAGADASNYRLGTSTASARASIAVRPLSTWTASTGGNWSDPANWDVMPDGANVASVLLGGTGSGAVTFDTAAPAATLQTLTTSRSLVVAANGLSAESLVNNAEVVIAAGVNWDLTRRSVAGSGTFTNRGTLTVVDGTLANALSNEGGSVAVGGTSRLGPVLNTGRFTLQPGAQVSVQGSYRQTSGTTTLGQSGAARPTLAVAAGAAVEIEGGQLVGSGTLDGSLVVGAAQLAPGYSPGAIAVTGNLTLGSAATTLVEVAGTQAGAFDFLDVTGRATVDGTLQITSYGGFQATGAERITFMQAGAGVAGTFSRLVNDDPLLAALPWSSMLIGSPNGSVAAGGIAATQQVEAVLNVVKPPVGPEVVPPTPPTVASLKVPGSGTGGSGGPGDPLNPVTKAGNPDEDDEQRTRASGDGVGPPAPVVVLGAVEQPFVEARPAQVRGGVRSLEFEPTPTPTVVNPATREVDRVSRERPGSGC